MVLVGRTEKKLLRVAEGIEKSRSLIHVGDVSRPEDVDVLISNTIARFGAIDVLVNNAAVTGVGGFLDKPASDWHEVISINLTGVFYLIRAALPRLLKTKGAIVNVFSIAGSRGRSGKFFLWRCKGRPKQSDAELGAGIGTDWGPRERSESGPDCHRYDRHAVRS